GSTSRSRDTAASFALLGQRRVRRAGSGKLTSWRNKPTDFIRRGKHDRRTVAHHASRKNRGCFLVWPFLAAVRFKSQVAFPKITRFSVFRCHGKGIATISAGFYPATPVTPLDPHHWPR